MASRYPPVHYHYYLEMDTLLGRHSRGAFHSGLSGSTGPSAAVPSSDRDCRSR